MTSFSLYFRYPSQNALQFDLLKSQIYEKVPEIKFKNRIYFSLNAAAACAAPVVNKSTNLYQVNVYVFLKRLEIESDN